MLCSLQIISDINKYSLLTHPFYQAWSMGKLDIATLKNYACQYFQHVNAFPRYISSIHTNCDDIKQRQILLDNLIDEEKGEENHPELWARFAEELGASRDDLRNTKLNQETRNLIDSFFSLSKSSFAEGIGALFAYEYQVPEVAKSKIEGLAKFYNITSDKGTKFFKVHIGADEWHSKECADLIDSLSDKEQQKAHAAALKTAQALWKFLDGVYEPASC